MCALTHMVRKSATMRTLDELSALAVEAADASRGKCLEPGHRRRALQRHQGQASVGPGGAGLGQRLPAWGACYDQIANPMPAPVPAGVR